MYKRHFVVSGMAGLMACILALGQSSGSTSSNRRTQAPQPNFSKLSDQDVPDHVRYDFLFHKVIFVKERIAKYQNSQAGGGGVKLPMRPMQQEVSLTDQEALALEEIAVACMAEVRQQDMMARGIINRFRARFPNGIVPNNQPPPPPPPELERMQEERNTMILHARDRLRASFGDQRFERFDRYVKTSINAR